MELKRGGDRQLSWNRRWIPLAQVGVFALLVGACSGGAPDPNRLEGVAVEAQAPTDSTVIVDAVAKLREIGTGRYEYRRVMSFSDASNEATISDLIVGRFADGSTRAAVERSFSVDGDDDGALEAMVGFDLESLRIDLVIDTDAFYVRFPDLSLPAFEERDPSTWIRFGYELYLGASLPDLVDEMTSVVPLLATLEALTGDEVVTPLNARDIGGRASEGYRVQVPGNLMFDQLGSGTFRQLLTLDASLTTPVDLDVWIREGIVTAVFVDLTELFREALDLMEDPSTEILTESDTEFSFIAELVISDVGTSQTVDTPADWTDLVEDNNAVSPYDLEPGQCLASEDLSQELFFALGLVDCAAEKRYEVYAVLPGSDFEAAMGDEAELERSSAQACSDALLETKGIAHRESVLQMVYLLPLEEDDLVCLLESPNMREGDLSAPVPFQPESAVNVTVVLLNPGLQLGYQQVSRLVATRDGGAVFAIGADNSQDPDDESLDNDIGIWRSDDGGRTYDRPETDAFSALPGNQSIHATLAVPEGILIAGSRNTDASASSVWWGSATGDSWVVSDLPIPEAVTEVFVQELIAVDEGAVLAIATLYGADYLGRIGVYRSRGRNADWELTDIFGDPQGDTAVTGAYKLKDRILIDAFDFDADVLRRWSSSDQGATWVSSTPLEDVAVDLVTNAGTLFSTGFSENVRRSVDGGTSWQDVALPIHDYGIASTRTIVADGETVLVAGVMTSRAGRAPAMWMSTDDGASFDLVWFDITVAGQRFTPLAAVVVDGGFAVAGESDPTRSNGVDNDVALWRVEVPS